MSSDSNAPEDTSNQTNILDSNLTLFSGVSLQHSNNTVRKVDENTEIESITEQEESRSHDNHKDCTNWTLFWHKHVYKKLASKPTPHYIENILGIPKTAPVQSAEPALSPKVSEFITPMSPLLPQTDVAVSPSIDRIPNPSKALSTSPTVVPTAYMPVARVYQPQVQNIESTAPAATTNEPLNLSIKNDPKPVFSPTRGESSLLRKE